MRLKFLFVLSILAASVLLISCNGIDHLASNKSPKPANTGGGTETTYADGARRVTIEELDAMIKSGEAFIVDVRDQASYDAGHIPNSILIPSAEIGNHLSQLPRDKTIVTYCS